MVLGTCGENGREKPGEQLLSTVRLRMLKRMWSMPREVLVYTGTYCDVSGQKELAEQAVLTAIRGYNSGKSMVVVLY